MSFQTAEMRRFKTYLHSGGQWLFKIVKGFSRISSSLCCFLKLAPLMELDKREMSPLHLRNAAAPCHTYRTCRLGTKRMRSWRETRSARSCQSVILTTSRRWYCFKATWPHYPKCFISSYWVQVFEKCNINNGNKRWLGDFFSHNSE